jgi:hypothetical protein
MRKGSLQPAICQRGSHRLLVNRPDGKRRSTANKALLVQPNASGDSGQLERSERSTVLAGFRPIFHRLGAGSVDAPPALPRLGRKNPLAFLLAKPNTDL